MTGPDLMAELDQADCRCGKSHEECAEDGGCWYTAMVADMKQLERNWHSDRDKLVAVRRLLTSGPIGRQSGERYIRADLIRAVLDGEQPGASQFRRCPACNASYRLNKDGRLPLHAPGRPSRSQNYGNCPGAHEFPGDPPKGPVG